MTTESNQDFTLGGGLPFFPAATNELGEGAALGISEPQLDVAFILAIANSNMPNAIPQVEQHHRNVWTAVNGPRLGALISHRRRFLDRVKLGKEQVRNFWESLRKVPVIVQQPAWSWWDWVKFGFALVGLPVLVGASMSTVFTLLRNTAVFEPMPIAAIITAGLVAAIPVAGKLGIDVLGSEVRLNRLRGVLGWGAVVCFCIWAVLLARLTGGLGGGVEDPLSMTMPNASESGTGGWGLSTHLQYLQLIVELLGSLACFSYADMLYQRNRPGRLAINGLFLAEFRRLYQALSAADTDARQLGEGKGYLRAVVAHREVFADRARARYLNALHARARRDSLRAEYSRVQSALNSVENELDGERFEMSRSA
jgi:hypothetical protein